MKNHMVVLCSRKLQARTNVVGLQKRIIGENFRPRSPISQELQHIFNPQTVAPNARPSATFTGFDGDA